MTDPIPHEQRIRLFDNERLEKLTIASPRAFAAIWAGLFPLIAWSAWGSADVPTGLALLLAGAVMWSLFEYAMHRFLFHWDAQWKPMKWLVFVLHGIHHSDPNDSMRNLMPPILTVPIGALLWTAFVALFGAAGTWSFLGFAAGYVGYDLTHFACHQRPMRGRLGMALKRHHMRHHFTDENSNYAITFIFWDRAFGSRFTSLKG